MSINDLPEDLFHYFPLVLGTTSKRFNKKINIYTRPIVVFGDPSDKYVDYKRLKDLDITFLQKCSRIILLQKIKPRILTIHNTDDIVDKPLSGIKKLTIKKIMLADMAKLVKITNKTDIVLEHLIVENRKYQREISASVKNLSVEKISLNITPYIYNLYKKDFIYIKTKHFVLDGEFIYHNIKYVKDWVNLFPDTAISIETIIVILGYGNRLAKFNCKKILDVDKCIKNLSKLCVRSLVRYNPHGYETIIYFVHENNVSIVGHLGRIKNVFDTINQPKHSSSLIYNKIKTGQFGVEIPKQLDSDEYNSSDSE